MKSVEYGFPNELAALGCPEIPVFFIVLPGGEICFEIYSFEVSDFWFTIRTLTSNLLCATFGLAIASLQLNPRLKSSWQQIPDLL